jgi:glutamyl-tRNA(Gln) amidotransferase subunit D
MKAGNKVKIILKDETIEGILMPSRDNSYFVKLKNGYNIGINKRNVKGIKDLGKVRQEKTKIKEIKQNKKLPKISILHTGGTIASKVDYKTGAVKAQFKPEELIKMFPELMNISNIESRLISNVMSENISFKDYNKIAREIEKEVKKGVKGIIITHGTDTLHYTSAALAFMLENIEIPVILVGSQRSSDRGSSDAAINLISACVYIVNSNDVGVRVCMHKNEEDDKNIIINGTKARKMHTSRRDAFKAINEMPIAEVDYKKKSVKIIRKQKQKEGKFKVWPFKDIKVGLVKVRPGMKAKEFEIYKNYDGLIIEGTGLGHAPIEDHKENEEIQKVIKKLCKKIFVGITSQTIYGRMNMNVYSTGRLLQELGVKGNNTDMTPETAYIKLAWLLSNNKTELYEKNLRGEISKRSENVFI